MKINGIDKNKCTGCGLCVRECAAGLFSEIGSKRVAYADPNAWCTRCGHCVAVCPENAVLYEAHENARDFTGKSPSYEETMNLLLGRRSIRCYAERDVPALEIERVLEAMRFAPSGHNAQACRYLIIKDEKIMKLLRDTTIDSFRLFRKIMKIHVLFKPFVSQEYYKILADPGTALGIDDMVRRYEAGKDPIFFNAPTLILVHVPDMGGMSYIDPAIAFTYGMLAAQARGLGSCWIGFAMLAVEKKKDILKRLDIPKNRMIAGVMTLGYPVQRYQRVPVRNAVNAVWRE